ncbi:transglutaminase-like domain-containing protein [Fusibacter sp. 3D3]|uniref:transglutaminase-like domain-containing protein n=1 Tax=Fusibacter sp. 3D3 TaxID=1048380 RepID=UPI000853DA6E|nr:transglutaminase-like domain-containing protein [Fusibacter sp. 3D3]GAU77810.1 transglutaminase-like enzyme [Fusibacter sp. 3D3]
MNLEYLRVSCPENIDNLVKMGAFSQARAAIERHMTLEIPTILKERLEHELLTMELIERDFLQTKSELFKALSPYIVGLDLAEIDTFESEGYLLWHMIEGEKKYHKRAVKTVLKENIRLGNRLKLDQYEPAKACLKEHKAVDLAIDKMRSTGEITVETTLKTSLKIKPEVLEGILVSAREVTSRFYLPLPRRAHFTKAVEVLETSSSNYQIASEQALQRVIYAEGNLASNTSDSSDSDDSDDSSDSDDSDDSGDAFEIKYRFLNHMMYRPLYEMAEQLEQKNKDETTDGQVDFLNAKEMHLKKMNLYGHLSQEDQEQYLKEKSPHILFTPLLVDLAHKIVEQETEPLIKAKRIYDYITQHIRYRFMGSYRMLLNIPEYGALNMRGDCGVQALLLITLLRIVGVPATFASGLTSAPDVGCGMHDWSAFYVEPYGWCFADASYGGSAYRRDLKDKWHFYFGNLDPYRMMSNFDFQVPFEFPKAFVREDAYDNQVGEVETSSGALFSDDYIENTQLIAVREVSDESI